MKNTPKYITGGLLVLFSLITAINLQAQPRPMDECNESGEPGMMGPRGGQRMEMRGQRPSPGRMAGQMFQRYDADKNGELTGVELSNVTLVMVVKQPPRRMEKSDMELDLQQQAEDLETRFLKDFDLDDSSGISMKEFLIAQEALEPGPPPEGRPGRGPGR